ncbi:HAD family hydrolase [Pacificoceanicola onchidii]|uniref:HAD family hydrolase n=1 Tax=Pacificoceanicola onchidii TaxID=2562685 RepID=UPI0010A65673|nr:HAD family phosphatase [Pacificoceanicola onchidii]
MPIKAVLWDMDGTLIDSEHLHISATAQAMEGLGLTAPNDLFLRINGMAAGDVHKWLQQDYGLDLQFDDWIKRKHNTYMRRIGEIAVFSQAYDLWQDLQSTGVKQAVVSNSDRLTVEANLGHLGLNNARQISVSRNDVRNGKPDPEPYLRAAWLLEVAPGDCIVLEDSEAGAKAGLAAGMTTFLVPNTPAQLPEGASRLKSFREIAVICGL